MVKRKWVMPYHLAIAPEFAVVGTCTESPIQVVPATDYDALAQRCEQASIDLQRAHGALVDAGGVPTEHIEQGIRALASKGAQAEAEVVRLVAELEEQRRLKEQAEARVKWLEKGLQFLQSEAVESYHPRHEEWQLEKSQWLAADPTAGEGEKENMSNCPVPMHAWLAKLPSQNVGTLYATIKTPFLPIYTEHRVDVWGQVCDGEDHKSAVHCMLYNSWPNHGKGFTYVSWRAVPDHPEANTYPREGQVANPQPYSGDAHD